MRRSDILKDPGIKAKIEKRFYRVPSERGDVFQASEQEIASSSIALQQKLQQNNKFFNTHNDGNSAERVMLPINFKK